MAATVSRFLIVALIIVFITAFTTVHTANAADPPKSRPAPIAIDFGSEFIKVSSVRPGAGSYHIVVDEQSKRKVPAVISFEGGERHFGNGATQLTMRKPKETYWYMHRLLGQSIQSPALADLIETQRFPYELVAIANRSSIGVVHTHNDGTTTLLTVEELIAMSLEHIVRISEVDSGAAVAGAVITVPPFFAQSQRQAILDAADLIGLNVYALVNENTGAAIQYGVDRKYDANTTADTVLFYNMGSTSTKVTIATFQPKIVKESARKNRTEGEVEVRANAYDATLGGQYFEAKLTQYIGEQVNSILASKGHKKDDIFTLPKQLAKIRSAAEKAKMVLSANQDTVVVLPSLLHDIDIKLTVTREQFIGLCTDLIQRVSAPIDRALSDAGLTAADLSSVIIIGGGVRVPAVQAAIKEAIGRQTLGQSLNGDEAMAMGAEFKSIELSRQFKTRPFTITDTTPYPMSVHLHEQGVDSSKLTVPTDTTDTDNTDPTSSIVLNKRAALFKRYNKMLKKKTVAFNHGQDFACTLSYEDTASALLPASIPLPIVSYNVSGLTAAASNPKYTTLLETQKPRVSLVFLLDSSGIVSLFSAEATLEEQVKVKVDKPKRAAVNTTANVTDEAENATTTATDGESDASTTADTATEGETADSTTTGATESTSDTSSDESSSTPAAAAAEEEVEYRYKKEIHRITLKTTVVPIPGATAPMSFADKREARARLAAYRRADAVKQEIAIAKNNLESYIYNTRSKANEGLWDSVSTDLQRNAILEALTEAEDWLYAQNDENSSAEIFINKLNDLKSLSEPVALRYTELTDLPKAIDASLRVLNFSHNQIDDYKLNRPWVSNSSLSRLYNLTMEGEIWLNELVILQGKTPATEPALLTSKMIYDKLMPLADYSAQLMKIRKPAEKPIKPPKKPFRPKFNFTNFNASNLQNGSTFNATDFIFDENMFNTTDDATTAESTNGAADNLDSSTTPDADTTTADETTKEDL